MTVTNLVEAARAVDADWLGLHGSRVLVAGAGGIGGACALAYAEAGASVAVVDRDQRALDALGARARSRAGLRSRADRGRPHRARRGRASRRPGRSNELGGLDVMLHAVGINDRRPILDFTEDEWDHILRVNLSSLFGLAQAAGRHMVDAGLRPRARAVERLGAARAPLARPVRRVQGRHQPAAARHGARVGAVRRHRQRARARATSRRRSPRGTSPSPASAKSSRRLVPAGRLGTPDELTGPALFLSSRHAGFITGHVLYIDGGRTLV